MLVRSACREPLQLPQRRVEREAHQGHPADPAALRRVAAAPLAEADHDVGVLLVGVNVAELQIPLLALAHAGPQGEGDEVRQVGVSLRRLRRDQPVLLGRQQVGPRIERLPHLRGLSGRCTSFAGLSGMISASMAASRQHRSRFSVFLIVCSPSFRFGAVL
ncbi:hypothetical protein [Sorangium cellulosum]|uniref:hypothetical protein n=1 Tax=Sorangium cellulosum TaxID=56 RepID=UPI0013311B0F|nr:hypothetical protein [Sorangium cellulosum]